MATLTKEAAAKHYNLRPGESWWVCEQCKHRILGRIQADGSLELRIRGYQYRVDPGAGSMVAISAPCDCERPAHQNTLILTRGT